MSIARVVTDDTFDAEVLANPRPVIVEYRAQWCGPCRQVAPVLDSIAADYAGVIDLVKVNVDENPRIAQTFGVQSIPAVFAIANGQVVDQFIGALPEAQVAAFVQGLAPPPSEADTLVAVGDEASLRRALELEPGHVGATEALARILIDKGDGAGALAALQRIPETDIARALAAEARLLLAGVDVTGADSGGVEAKLDELLDRVRDDDDARQEFVDLLETMGAGDPRTNEYRRALAARLF
ncbi:MAG TPA: thioredoxin [Acidimicrobiales bacterium]